MLKISIIFKKNANFAGKITRALLDIRMRHFQIFMYSNIQEDFQMRKCTFKMETRKLQRNFLSLFVLALHFEIIENITENQQIGTNIFCVKNGKVELASWIYKSIQDQSFFILTVFLIITANLGIFYNQLSFYSFNSGR